MQILAFRLSAHWIGIVAPIQVQLESNEIKKGTVTICLLLMPPAAAVAAAPIIAG
jgi:hypothetical protein